jgi:signal transduction histidine kinase
MTAEVQARIREPLFTTKNFGTGLGVPAVEKILEQHGGGLDIWSEPEKGARFTVWWPQKLIGAEAA